MPLGQGQQPTNPGATGDWNYADANFDASEAMRQQLKDAHPGIMNAGTEAQLEHMFDILKLNYQNKWNEYMWDKENDWNSTPNQLGRWMAAGLNPNAFAGNTGNASSVTSSSGGAPSIVGATAQNAKNWIGAGTDLINTAVNADKTYWENQKLKAETEAQEITNGTLGQMNERAIQKTIADTKKAEADTELTRYQADQVKELTPLLKNKTSAEIDEITEKKNNLVKEGQLIVKNMDKVKWETRKEMMEAYAEAWKNWYRESFGADPDKGWEEQIISAVLSSIAGKENAAIGGVKQWLNSQDGKATMKKLGVAVGTNPAAAAALYAIDWLMEDAARNAQEE